MTLAAVAAQLEGAGTGAGTASQGGLDSHVPTDSARRASINSTGSARSTGSRLRHGSGVIAVGTQYAPAGGVS